MIFYALTLGVACFFLGWTMRDIKTDDELYKVSRERDDLWDQNYDLRRKVWELSNDVKKLKKLKKSS